MLASDDDPRVTPSTGSVDGACPSRTSAHADRSDSRRGSCARARRAFRGRRGEDGASTDADSNTWPSAHVGAAAPRNGQPPAGDTPGDEPAPCGRARFPILVDLDGHSSPPPDYVRRLVEHLRSGDCEAVGGSTRATGTSSFGRATALAHNSRLGIGDSKHHYATDAQLVDHVAFPAYVTDRARNLGGWDEHLVRNQDAEFDFRYRAAGGRILLDPSWSWTGTSASPSASSRSSSSSTGSGASGRSAMHPGSFRPRWLAPPATVAALLVGAALSWWLPGALLLVATAAVSACSSLRLR